MKSQVLKIRVNRVPPAEYLTAGETYLFHVSGKQDVRVRRLDDSAGTYVRRYWFDRSLADGSFEVIA